MTQEEKFKWFDWLDSQVRKHVEGSCLGLMDNHDSNTTSRLILKAKEKGWRLVSLVPASSHILQPCDRTVNRAFKEHLKKEMSRFRGKHEGSPAKLTDFPLLIENALRRATDRTTINEAWEQCGFLPSESDIKAATLARQQAQATQPSAPSTRSRSEALVPCPPQMTSLTKATTRVVGPRTILKKGGELTSDLLL
jgi:DDE superfamily endonuclease